MTCCWIGDFSMYPDGCGGARGPRHDGGGTILQMPDSAHSGSILAMYAAKSANSSSVGRKTGAARVHGCGAEDSRMVKKASGVSAGLRGWLAGRRTR